MMNKPTKYGLILVLALVTVAGVIYLDTRYRDAQYQEAVARFQLLGTLRSSTLQTYFNTARAEVSAWSLSERIHQSMLELRAGWNQLGTDPGSEVQRLYIAESVPDAGGLAAREDAGDGSAYSRAHAKLHAFAREFVTGRGYYDFFLIDLDGNVIYSVEKEPDFGSSLTTGPFKESGLAGVFKRLTAEDYAGEVVISDLARYAPSHDAPAIFAGTLMRDAEGDPLGVLALQLPSDTIGEIMHFTTGMGESGETYLVGGDLLMRSDSRFSNESTVLEKTVDTETVRLALEGQRGAGIVPDYRGIMVLSAYDFIDFNGIRWAVMAEIDAEEVEQTVGDFRGVLSAAGFAIFSMVLVTFWTLRDTVFPEIESLAAEADIHLDAD